MPECTTLPCSSTTEDNGTAFEIINNGLGPAIGGRNTNNVGVGSIGVGGNSINSIGVSGVSINSIGVSGVSTNDVGVSGTGNNGTGVMGVSRNTAANPRGIHGIIEQFTQSPSSLSVAVYGENRATNSGIGVWGHTDGTGYGVWGTVDDPFGYAGFFTGRVQVNGFLTKSGGGFHIDHPSDPANKYLNHFFVESSEMKNLYDGVVTLDRNGEAVVELPEWFEDLNQDFRYQLTCIGEYAPVYVAQKIERSRLRNSFKIAGGISGMEVSWQVTGIRKDAWAQAHSMAVEEEKSDNQRGYYLHPEVYGQSEERSIEWADNPEAMRQLKEERENPPRIEIPKALEEQ